MTMGTASCTGLVGTRWHWWLVSLVVAGVAFSVRLAMVLRGGGLGGMFGYDDGVYFSAASSVSWGRLPYRDFVLLHPPGIVWALLPFAGLARVTSDALGLEVARLAWMALGALNAVLVVAATRRLGVLAAAVAGMFYAVWNPGAGAETTTRLEPLLNLGVLAAVALLVGPGLARRPRVQVLAGAALGLALATKIWAVVPVLLVLLWCWRGSGGRAARRVALSSAAGVVALCLPFWLLAPRSMTRMVVLDQVGRPRSTVSVADRLVAILGAPRSGNPATADPATLAAAGWGPAAWTAALVLLGLMACALASRRSDRLGRLAVTLLVAQVGVLLVSPPFFGFYPAYVAPAMALTVGTGVAGLAGLLRRTTRDRAVRRWPLAARAAGVGVLGLALLPLVAVDAAGRVGVALPAAGLRPLASTSRCVTSDRPDLLILLDVLGRNLQRDCPTMVDVTGLTYDVEHSSDDASHVQRRHNTAWQHTLRSYLLSGGAALLGRPGGDGLSPYTVRVLHGLPVLGQGDGYRLYAVPAQRRTTAPRVPEDRGPSLMALLAP